jgi:hypothetical protein
MKKKIHRNTSMRLIKNSSRHSCGNCPAMPVQSGFPCNQRLHFNGLLPASEAYPVSG